MQDRLNIYVRERKDRPGKWRVDVRGGSRGRSTRDFSSEAEAKTFAAEVSHAAQATGEIIGDRTVGGMIEGYMRSLEGRQLKPATITHRREMLVAPRSILGAATPLRKATQPDAIKRFQTIRSGQVGVATFRHNVWALQKAFEWAHGQGWIDGVPEMEVPKAPPPRQEWLRSYEVQPFLESCSTAFRPLAEAAIFLGLREGEICVAQACDVDLHTSNPVIWVREKSELCWSPKNKRRRWVPLVGRGFEIATMIAQRPPDAWAWPSQKGERRKPGTWFSRATKQAAEGAGIKRDLVFHDLRRTFGATMIESGAHIRAVQQALGHASIRTTEAVYAPISQSFVADAMKNREKMLEELREARRASEPQPPPRLRVVR
jgi:integrase